MKYDVFISYRRKSCVDDARLLQQALKSRGYNVFFDYDSLRDGKFDTKIFEAIDEAPIFILMLAEGSLDNCVNKEDWVRKEIEYALEHGRKIIPVCSALHLWTTPDFLPDHLKPALYEEISELNKRSLFEESVDKIIKDRFTVSVKQRKQTKSGQGEGDVEDILTNTKEVHNASAKQRKQIQSEPDDIEEILANAKSAYDALFDKAKKAYDQDDYETSFQIFKKLSDLGYSQAYVYLGMAYEFNKGVTRDLHEAELYYKKSVDANDNYGYTRLGMLYKRTKKYKLAYELYQKAIDKGFAGPNDYLQAAQLLEKGMGVTRNINKAIEYYKIVMEAGNFSSLYREAEEALGRLGSLYSLEDFNLTLPPGLAVADADRLYLSGKERMEEHFEQPPDVPFAFVCFLAAANKGHALAAFELSKLLADPKYPIFDQEKANEYAKIAFDGMVGFVEQNPSFAWKAGYAYQYELDGIRHIDKAIYCYQIGAKNQDKNCEWSLGEVFQKTGKKEQAFELFSLASERGQGMAMYELAQCYEFGIGTQKDINKAIHWYEQCVKSNYAAASDAEKRLQEIKCN